MKRWIQPRAFCHVLKFASEIVVEHRTALRAVVRNEQIDFPVTVIVEKASSGTEKRSALTVPRLIGLRNNPRLLRHIHKLTLNLRWRFQHRRRRFQNTRVLPLLAISQAHGEQGQYSRVLEWPDRK